jgi:hypothetical protein
MRRIRALRTVFAGERTWNAGESFELDEVRARDLVKAGIAEFVVDMPAMAMMPGPAAAEQAVSRRQKAK